LNYQQKHHFSILEAIENHEEGEMYQLQEPAGNNNVSLESFKHFPDSEN
jgi:hypothetical protein